VSTKVYEARHYLIDVQLRREAVPSFDRYPFAMPAVKHLRRIRFHPAVTFIVGENGSGKSTLLEAIAIAWGFNAEGGSKNFNFATRASHSELHEYLRPLRSLRRPRDGYFLRAESYFNVATQIDRIDEGPGGRRVIDAYGGRSLHEQSHGESFFALLQHRFKGRGFYILDEPEAALSPTRQMSFIARLHELVRDESQFLIATHSPIIMAYPNADILAITRRGLKRVAYTETEHYRISRAFLTRHETMLAELMKD
jgi:predicted ATPase